VAEGWILGLALARPIQSKMPVSMISNNEMDLSIEVKVFVFITGEYLFGLKQIYQ
jgi:hypothetical protein